MEINKKRQKKTEKNFSSQIILFIGVHFYVSLHVLACIVCSAFIVTKFLNKYQYPCVCKKYFV